MMNLAYFQFKDVFEDNIDMYVKFSNNFIKDPNAKEGKVYNYCNKILK